VPRGRVPLEAIEHRQPGVIRQVHIEHDRGGPEFLRERHAGVRGLRDEALEAEVVREVVENPRKRGIVLDDEQHAGSLDDAIAIVLDGRSLPRGLPSWRRRGSVDSRRHGHVRHARRRRYGGGDFGDSDPRCRGFVLRGKRQREGTPLSRRAFEADLTTEQPGQIARDGQTEPGAAVAPVGGAVGLAERFEDRVVLRGRNTDAGVAHDEVHTVAAGGHPQLHLAAIGEFQRVRQQVQHDLGPEVTVDVHLLGERRAVDGQGQPEAQHRHGNHDVGQVGRVGADPGQGSDPSRGQERSHGHGEPWPEPVADDARESLTREFREEIARGEIDGVDASPGMATVAVVGLGMHGTPGIAAGVFSALAAGGINVVAIAQGSSELNISVVVEAREAAEAQRRIHAAFQLSRIAGGAVIRPFAFALLVGFISGVYSTIFIASPVILLWDRGRKR